MPGTVLDLIDGGTLLRGGCLEEGGLRFGEFRVGALAPFEDGTEAGSSVQVVIGLPSVSRSRGRRERTHGADALGVVLEPASEARPRRRERLVRDDERVLLGADQAGAGEARQHAVMRASSRMDLIGMRRRVGTLSALISRAVGS